MKSVITGILVLWLAVVFLLGGLGTFERPPGTAPVPILIGAVGPLVVFLAAYWGSALFRAFVLAIDLPLATAIQAWQAGGLGFLALYAHGLLPGFRLAGRTGRYRDRRHCALGCPCPRPQTRICH